jgi:ubiquinone biosynthesis protein
MLFLGLLSAGLVVGGLVVLAARSSTALGIAALAGAFVLSGVAALYHLATLRMRKISVRKFFER